MIGTPKYSKILVYDIETQDSMKDNESINLHQVRNDV